MSISSINTSIGSAAQSPQQPSLINNASSGSTQITNSSSPSSTAKLNSDWLKIKVSTQPVNQTISVQDETKDSNTADKSKLATQQTNHITTAAAAPISQTASNFVKHKIVSTASTTTSGSIQIHISQQSPSTGPLAQVPSTLTLSGPKNIIKSTTTPASPTTNLNLTQFTKITNQPGTKSPGITVLNSSSPSDTPSIKSFSLNNTQTTQNADQVNIGTLNIPNPRKVNVNGSKISLQGSSSVSSNSNTINNLVKNILSSGTSNNAAIANATAAVTAAASTFTQMNNDITTPKIITKNTGYNNSQHPIITTLMANNSESSKIDTNQMNTNNTSSNAGQVHQIAKLQGNSNQINLPPTTLNINNTQASGQLPKITVLTALNSSNASSVQKGVKPPPPQGRVITTTSSPTIDTSTASSITKTTIPISLKASSQPSHQQLIPINSNTNGQISNIVSGINLRTLSPISFSLPVNANNDAKVNTLTSSVKSSSQNSTTPSPPSTTNNQQPLTINATNISNLISKSIANNLMGSTPSINNQGNVYRTITQPSTVLQDTDEPTNNTQAYNKPMNNFTNTNSQTIAQICSNLNNQYQIQQVSNSPSLQPIRYINNSQLSQHAKIYQNTNNQSVQLQQLTLSNNSMQINTSVKKPSNNNLVSNASLPQSSSSPSASPLKPNIIRKPRRDSPSHSNLNSITISNTDQQQHQIINMYHQPSAKHPIYELTQAAMVETANIKNPVTVQLLNQVEQQNSSTENIYQNQAQILSIPSSSSPSSSSSSSSSNPKSIVNLIAESSSSSSSSDVAKSLRKYTLNTQLNLPTVQQVNVTQPKESWATASSLASSSSSSPAQSSQPSLTTTKPLFHLSSQTDLPSSSAQPTSSTSTQKTSNEQPELPTSRKRRKQEFKKISDDHSISYNSNPLSNNSALAYSMTNLSPITNRYMNDNTTINTNTNNNMKSFSTEKLDSIEKQLKIDKLETNDDTTARFTKKIRFNLYQNSSEQMNPNDKSMELNSEEKILVSEIRANLNEAHDSKDCLDDETVQLLSKEFRYVASNGVTWTSKRNRSHIYKSYKSSWKPRNNHYLRYSDVKFQEKANKSPVKKMTQKELIENLNEWKFHFVISQVKNLITFENESLAVIDDVESLMQNSDFFDNYSDITIKINESIKANSQRHKHVNEQLDEAQQLINELFDHKEKFKSSILMSTSKNSSESSNSLKVLQKTSIKSTQQCHTNSIGLKGKNFNLTSSKKGISTRSSQLKNSPINNIIDKSAASRNAGLNASKMFKS